MFLFEIPLFLERRRERRSGKRPVSLLRQQMEAAHVKPEGAPFSWWRDHYVAPSPQGWVAVGGPGQFEWGTLPEPHHVQPSGSASNWHVHPVRPVIGQKSVQEAMADLRRLGEMRDEIVAAQAEVKAIADELAKRQKPS